MRRILVVRAGAIGDGLLTLPALAALRTRWPAAVITLVGPRSLLPFARAARLVDVGLPVEGDAGLALLGNQPGHLPDLEAADLAVVWLQHPEAAARRLQDWGCNTVLAGPSLPPEESAMHVADHLFTLLAGLDIGPAWPNHPKLVPSAEAETADRWWKTRLPANGDGVIAVHPGSGGAPKCWPEARYVALVEVLIERGYGVLLVQGPAEEDGAGRWQALAARFQTVVVAADLPLPIVAGLLAHCSGYVGNDSGITHLAAVLGVPTLAIFGPTDPVRWAPVGPAVRVLRDPGWVLAGQGAGHGEWRLTVSDVLDSVIVKGNGLGN